MKSYILSKFNSFGQLSSHIEATLRKTLTLEPNLPMEYSALGIINLQKGNAEQARYWAKQALALDQNDPGSIYILDNLNKIQSTQKK